MGRQGWLFPIYHYQEILTRGDDLPLAEVVESHRRKQGQENAFTGPLVHLGLHHPPCLRFRAKSRRFCW